MMIYKTVKRLAREKGLSVHQLEIKAGIGNGIISRWRVHTPCIANLIRVANVLEVDIDKILEEAIDSAE